MAEDRKPSDDRKYAVVSKDTVRTFAETVGYSHLAEDVGELLSEDVTYRLRELIQHSCHFLRHGRRKKLTTEDINRALRNSDTPPIFGHGTHEMLPFRQTKEAELFVVDDLDINLPNLAYGNQAAPQVGKPSVKAYWLAVEGAQKPDALPQTLQVKPPVPPPTTPKVGEELLEYYDNVTKAILGNEAEITKLALVDLRTNSKISPLTPYFINFFANGVRTVNHDVHQLMGLLHMMRALTSNKSLNLEPVPYLSVLVSGVLHCVVDPLAASVNPHSDHWRLRDYAARLLAIITRDWARAVGRESSLSAYREVLMDLSRPFCSHYGAVMGLLSFGTQAVEDVLLPLLPTFWSHLETSLSETTASSARVTADAYKVHGALLLASEYLLRARVHGLESEPPPDTASPPGPPKDPPGSSEPSPPELSQEQAVAPPVEVMAAAADLLGPVLRLPDDEEPPRESSRRPLCALYRRLAACFGDRLCARWPVDHFPAGVYSAPPAPAAPRPRDTRTGEELLRELERETPEPASPPATVRPAAGMNVLRRPRLSHLMLGDGDDDEDDSPPLLTLPAAPPALHRPLAPMRHALKIHDVLVPEAGRPRARHALSDAFSLAPPASHRRRLFVFRILGCERVCDTRRNTKWDPPPPAPPPPPTDARLSTQTYGKRRRHGNAPTTGHKRPGHWSTGSLLCTL